jgi:antitoxin (DNA-binding transcriptional repressor) of toxin-antitoxin stability system
MVAVALERSGDQLAKLIDQLTAEGEVCITRQGRVIARLIPEQPPAKKRRTPGSACGILRVVEEDESHLADFREYME